MIEPLLFTLASLAALFLFIYGLVLGHLYLWLTGLLAYFFGFPIFLDLLFTLFACCCRFRYAATTSALSAPYPRMPRRLLPLYSLTNPSMPWSFGGSSPIS